MSKKIIDVSTWNVINDYGQVKKDGVEGAILKVINRKGNADDRFEIHYRGFTDAGVPIIAGYNYSYATTVNQAVADAKKVIAIADGRIPEIFLDVEDRCQKGIGKRLIDIIIAYQKQIVDAKLEFGVYTGLSFYNTYIKPHDSLLNCDFWIARYPSNVSMRVSSNPDSNKQPRIRQTLIGWQYSSKGSASGIVGDVDLNLWYDNITNIERPLPSANFYTEPTRVIKKAFLMQHGNDVKWVQYHLVRLGFLLATNRKGKSNIDGWCGSETVTAIGSAQRHFNIMDDGKCGVVTREYLKTK